MKELRETVRFCCQEEVICRLGKRKIQATIVDVSRGGLRLRLTESLRVGQQVEIKPKHRSRGRSAVLATVRWQFTGSQMEAGLEFLEPAGKISRKWLRNLFPSKTEGRQQRTEVRAGCSLPILSADGKWEGELKDLSESGACFVKNQKSIGPDRVFLCLPWGYIEVTATPVRTCKEKQGWTHSVKLSELEPEQRDHLVMYLEQSIKG